MTGDRLEADVHIVTGAVASVRNLVRCCEIAGVETADIVLEPLASAESVLSADEKVKGVALVDIGGGTTDIAVYKDRVLRHTAVLALGGNHITNDIAVGLGLPVAEAERIKKAYGCVVEGMVDEKGGIDASDAGSRMMKIHARSLVEIIHPRCEELMSLIKKEIWMSQKHMKETFFGSGVSGVVLTGGTSLLRGIDMMAEEIFGLPVRIGIPDSTGDISVKSPVYSTGVGLIAYGLDRSEKQGEMRSEKALTSRDIFERMKYWVRGFF
jgi:cell division protein FtsA